MLKKQNITTILILSASFIFAFFTGCTKTKVTHKIEGVWDKVWVEDLSTINKERWIFKPDNTIIIMRNFYNATPMPSMDTIEIGHWKVEIDAKKNPKNIQLYDFKDGNESYYNGKWIILTLNKKELFMVNKECGRLFREFTKAE